MTRRRNDPRRQTRKGTGSPRPRPARSAARPARPASPPAGRGVEVIGELRRPGETPDLALPVVAVAGRSNVGKSTLLNALLGRRRLLRTSRTPGCTRTIQLVAVESPEASFVLADLPGYGYAALSRERRASWGPLVEGFLRDVRRLAAVLLLIDVRRGPQKEEQELLDFLGRLEARTLVVWTKCDKLPRSKAVAAIEKMRGRVRGLPTVATAGATGFGIDDVWQALLRRVAGPLPTAKPRAAGSEPRAKSQEPKAKGGFLAARTAAQEGRHDEAIAACHDLLREDPHHRGAMDLLGFAHFFKREYAAAEDWCRRTLAEYPAHAYAHKGLGLCLARQGRLEDGLVHLRRATELEPAFFDPYWDTAVVLREAGRYAEAAEVLRRGVAECPERAAAVRAVLEDLERRAAE